MAVSKTTFAQRMAKIESGDTTSWTVPGQGLADTGDERRFLSKARVKTCEKSTQKKVGVAAYLLALLSGALCVIAARWIDFRFLDLLVGAAAARDIDLVPFLSTVPTAFILALTLAVLTMVILGLRKGAIPVHIAGFCGVLVFEADLVALAPDLYAMIYPPAWVVDMMASAVLVT